MARLGKLQNFFYSQLFSSGFSHLLSPQLQSAELKVMRRELCVRAYGAAVAHSNVMCAQGLRGSAVGICKVKGCPHTAPPGHWNASLAGYWYLWTQVLNISHAWYTGVPIRDISHAWYTGVPIRRDVLLGSGLMYNWMRENWVVVGHLSRVGMRVDTKCLCLVICFSPFLLRINKKNKLNKRCY